MLSHIILVARRSDLEAPALNAGCYRSLEPARSAQLRQESGRSLPLLRILREDCRSILRANVGALSINLGWIVSDEGEYIEELIVADLRRIEADPDGLSGTGPLAARTAECWSAASVTRYDVAHAFHMLEHALDAPEATTSKHCRIHFAGGCSRMRAYIKKQ